MLQAIAAELPVSNLKPDEQILFFPAIAQLSPDGNTWTAEIRGCVFENEERRYTLALLLKTLDWKGVQLTPEEQSRLQQRARLFMVDNQRGKNITADINGKRTTFPRTGADGVFRGSVTFPAQGLPNQDGASVRIRALLATGDSRSFGGTIYLLQPTGTLVVSDIDDTIKLTGIGNTRDVLRSTLIDEFRPTPGTPALFQSVSRQGAAFIYLSASPWQLYPPLSEFLKDAGFPQGAFVLKDFRVKDKTRSNLHQSPWDYKIPRLEYLMKQYPQRKFVLVGDAGEQDPEIYAECARLHPGRVVRVLIRDPKGQLSPARKERVARGLPPGTFESFE
jgi:phosphatidate phosphatase APP1